MAMFVAFSVSARKQGAAEPPSNSALRFVRDIVDAGMLGALVWVGAWPPKGPSRPTRTARKRLSSPAGAGARPGARRGA